MKRRDFFAASAVAGLALGGPAALRGASAAAGGKQLLELRRYTFESNEKRNVFDQFLKSAAVPAINRAGIKPVGVFVMNQEENPKIEVEGSILYVLLPHDSFESMLTMVPKLADDWEFTDQAGVLLEAPKNDPLYKRYETQLMLGFDECPKVEVPTTAKTRLMQLRTYESHNTERAIMKIHMFNEGGEIGIFRKCGMTPVFFGSSLAGTKLPNLTYMLSFEDEAAQKEGWNKFRVSPEWKALNGDETYKDTVSNITNIVVRPGAGSQI